MTDPAGSISLAESHLAAMLADCPFWQTWTGSADAAEAAAHVYVDTLPAPAGGGAAHTKAQLEGLRPWAILYTDDVEGGFRRRQIAMSDTSDFADSGRLIVEVADNIAADDLDDPAEIARKFKNNLGQLIDELAQRAGQAGFLAFREIALREGPYRTAEDVVEAQGEAVGATLVITWEEVIG